MGDRCYLQVTCLPEHAERFKELMSDCDYGEQSRNHDGTMTLFKCEANYAFGVSDGCSGDLPNDIPYTGEHGNGDDYAAGFFACDGKEFVYCNGEYPNMWIGFDPKTGEPIASDLAQAKHFWEVYRRADQVPAKPVTT